MIEVIVLNFLRQRLPYPVSMEVPVNPPDKFFVLQKVDSARQDYIDTSMFIVWSYAESNFEAAKMNEIAKNAMDDLADLDAVSASKRAGDYPFPDAKLKRYRYQTVHNITHY